VTSQSPLSDGELVASCRSGDGDAWRALVERFSRYVNAIATQAFRLPPHAAEDVFQEVFARTYEHLNSLRNDEAIRPWIEQLTRRLCIDYLRSRSREVLSDEIESAEVEETLSLLVEALSVQQALAGLPEPCGEILDRFFCQDQSYETIGDALGLPAGTLASRISRCLGELREHLEGNQALPAPSRRT
jgi:RNA polymerase sigma-70 factor (ECF subfamily)